MSRTRTPSDARRVDPFECLPDVLGEEVKSRWEVYRQISSQAGQIPSFHRDFMPVLGRVWASSDFVVHSCIRAPELLPDLLESGDLLADYGVGELAERVAVVVEACRDIDELSIVLRQLRRREMVRIAWRDLAGWAPVEEVLSDLSDLANACISHGLERLTVWQGRRRPQRADGKVQSLVVLAMGKLGAGELNFSSDIDLIFAYPEAGQFRGRNAESYEEYFTRLGQSLIQVLSDTTAEGMVYRVDMRLRPYGESGPLVMSFDAMEDYYQSQGRDWERYAMIKANAVAGDPVDCAELMKLLQPFVYRKYLDFGAFEALREMKAMIRREVERRGLAHDVKLGPGGIREVEFIVQAFQLIRGGREPVLRERRLLRVLDLLAERDYIPIFSVRQLAAAYRFLRRVENRLQAYADRQTHRLPADEPDRGRLAFSMGYADWDSFRVDLIAHRQVVQSQFDQVFAAPQAEVAPEAAGEAADMEAIWADHLPHAAALEALLKSGYAEPAQALSLLEQFREGFACRSMSAQGRSRLDRLMPLLLGAVGAAGAPNETLVRIVDLLEAIARRSAYIALLNEHPIALSQLVRLCSASPWIAARLASHPLLLDELLDPRTLYVPPDRAALEAQLDTGLDDVDPDDLERQMDCLREIKQIAILRVAAADVVEALPLMVVSDHLTMIAEVMLERVLALVWRYMVAAHGEPTYKSGGQRHRAGFAIIGYGKMGGVELGYGSDLDLIFLHDGHGSKQHTSGKKRLDNGVFFARLGQRIIHMLNTVTAGGVLYEVDMRLRPSGASGLLVSSLEGFAQYQREDAWTWEHQALVRARAVAGNAVVRERFAEIRHEILSQQRDSERLRAEVCEMASRMRAELDRSNARRFMIKHGTGGITDIEFMVQYNVLSCCHDYPDLSRYTDNIRLLGILAEVGVFEPGDAESLGSVYQAYRERAHALALVEQPAQAEAGDFAQEREAVRRLWQSTMRCDN